MMPDGTWNCNWEYENQELLKSWYEEKISGKSPNLAVRKIICKGCGREFYTQIATKKYCYYTMFNATFQKKQKADTNVTTTGGFLQ